MLRNGLPEGEDLMSLIEKEQDDERDRRASAEVWREVTSTAVARQDAPRDRDNGVLITTSSHFSASQSVAASSAASSGFGQAFLEGANVSLGLKKLNRPEWNIEEITRREQVLPILKKTVGQIDGTIKPKFSQFAKNTSKAQNLEEFGMQFYEELFLMSPELKTTLFKDKPLGLLAIKLGTIIGELIRLLELPSPQALANSIAEMSLKHVEYGLEPEHSDPFRNSMVNALKKVVKSKGHKWDSKMSKAWSWALKEVISILVEATVSARPKIASLKRSWLLLCERLYEEGASKNKKAAAGSVVPGTGDAGPDTAPPASAPSAAEVNPFVSKWKSIRTKTSVATMLSRAARKEQAPKPTKIIGGTEYPMWSKLAGGEDTPEYIEGRDLVGAAFVEIFASQNAWAVKDFNYGLNPEHAKKMGLALELIVSGATKPQKLQQKLRVLGLGHVQMGIKPEMFPSFEKALFTFLQQVLSMYHMWDRGTEEAWHWIWKIVEGAFVAHLKAAENNMKVLTDSWDHISENHDIGQMSDKFFKLLFQRSPELQKMFVKPRKMMVVMFVKALDLIVRSVSDATVLDGDLKAVALRHIKYDIGPETLSVFGEVLIATLQDVVGVEKWDEETTEAWKGIYGNIAQMFGHIISTGRNLVSKALAIGNPEELLAALDNVPRCKRVLAALEIEVDDTAVSPIVWTLKEGQGQLAGALIKDLLTIRGDRDGYYYGRQMLWAKLPFIVPLLIEQAPGLLPVFLDGHLWTSRFMEEGFRRVNYYVKELYGDPHQPQNHNVYNTTLGHFVAKLPASELGNFAHPCISFLITLKWDLFGRRDFLIGQFLNLLTLLLSSLYMQIGVDNPLASLTLCAAQLLTAAMRLMLYGIRLGTQIKFGNGTTYSLLCTTVFVPYVLQDIFTLLNIMSSCFILALFALTCSADPFNWKSIFGQRSAEAQAGHSYTEFHDSHKLEQWCNVAAITNCLLWLQISEIFKYTPKLSALLFALSAILAEVGRFLLVLLFWVAGFSVILYWLLVGDNLRADQDLHHAVAIDLHLEEDADLAMLMYYIIMSSLGLTGVQVILESSWLVRLLYAVCVLSTVVVILNLLVSTMVSTYEHLQKGFHEMAMKARAELVIMAEESLPLRRRKIFFDSLGFDNPVDFEKEDDGPTGGIQRMVPGQDLKHPAFSMLDCVHRYSGSSNPQDVWLPSELLSSGIDSSELFGAGNSNSNSANRKALGRVTQELGQISEQLFMLKRGLVGDYAASVAASSLQSGISEEQNDVKNGGSSGDLEEGDGDHLNTASDPPTLPAVGDKPEPEPTIAVMREVGAAELAQHAGETSPWLVINGTVFDVTSLMRFHPGGKAALLGGSGKDATALFKASHQGPSSTIAEAMLKSMPIIGKYNPYPNRMNAMGAGPPRAGTPLRGSLAEPYPPAAPRPDTLPRRDGPHQAAFDDIDQLEF